MDELQLLLSEKKHRELIKKLDDILQGLKTDPTPVDLSEIIKAINDLKNKGESDAIPKAILALSDVIISKVEKMQLTKKEWTFLIERDNDGYITTVKAK